MKDVSTVILASLCVVIMLISLITAEHDFETTKPLALEKQETVSDLGLRFAFKR